MTNPSDPWAQRPDSPDAPTEHIGRGGPTPTTEYQPADYAEVYGEGYGYGNPPGEPYQYFDQPPGPNATRELPSLENQWRGDEQPYGTTGRQRSWDAPGPGGPTGLPVQPPRRRRTGLWIGLTFALFVLVVLAAVAAGLTFAGHGSSSSSSAGAPGPRNPTVAPLAPPPASGAQPSMPALPGLGGMDNIGGTMGTVSTNDGATLTVQSLLGSTVTVHTDDNTEVIALGGGKVSDLRPGVTIVVQGDKSPDGSIQAKIIIGTQLPR
jgi:hypothetical protein